MEYTKFIPRCEQVNNPNSIVFVMVLLIPKKLSRLTYWHSFEIMLAANRTGNYNIQLSVEVVVVVCLEIFTGMEF